MIKFKIFILTLLVFSFNCYSFDLRVNVVCPDVLYKFDEDRYYLVYKEGKAIIGFIETNDIVMIVPDNCAVIRVELMPDYIFIKEKNRYQKRKVKKINN